MATGSGYVTRHRYALLGFETAKAEVPWEPAYRLQLYSDAPRVRVQIRHVPDC